MNSRYHFITSAASSRFQSIGPAQTVSHRVRLKQERGHDAEVPPSAAHRPEQVRILLGARDHEAAVSQHHIDREQVVDRQPVLPGQVSHSSAQRQPGNPGARDDARRHSQAEGVRRMVHIAPLAARAHQHGARGRIHPHVVDRRQIDHQAVVADAQTGRIVPAAADRNLQTIGLRHPHGGHHIGDIGALGDQPRPAIDHPVIDFPRLLVRRIFRLDHCAAELAAKFGNSLL